MEEALGLSHLYPALPIMNVLSMVLCLVLIPGFWKTRIVAMVALVVWIFLANLMNFIGMIQWHGNTNDVPIWADFIAVFWRMWGVGCLASMACFAHFTWQRLQPVPIRQLYDTRRRNNLIHFVVCVIVPILWAPLFLVSLPCRYYIIEDFGPSGTVRWDWPGLVLSRAPQILSYLAVILFNTLALVTYWRMKQGDVESDLSNHHSSVRTRKLLLLALCGILLAAYGIFGMVRGWVHVELVAPHSFAENIASLQIVLRETRSVVGESVISMVSTRVAVPLLGFYVFAWFGCGEEARKAYREALVKPVRLMSSAVEEHQPHVGASPSPWSCIIFQRPKLPQGLANSLLPTCPNAPQITPYIPAVPRDNEPSETAANDNPSGPVVNAIDIKRLGRAPAREPVRRLSMHKPPTATLNPANATSSASIIPLRRVSHHKPPFVLVSPNLPAIAGPDASGSIAQRVEGMDSARRQKKFAPRSPPRRLSYHKPIFGPLAPANAGAIANGLGPTVPPVEAPRDLISRMNARLQAERALDSGVASPPFSSPSTSTAPPPFSASFASMSAPPGFSSPSTSAASLPLSDVSTSTTPVSTPSTRTPAPPYQHLNPFDDHVLQSGRDEEIVGLSVCF